MTDDDQERPWTTKLKRTTVDACLKKMTGDDQERPETTEMKRRLKTTNDD